MSEPTVLIIDDDRAVQIAIAEDLRREGYNRQFAEDGRHGLRLVQEIAPTVIILDLRMPVMDGFEFLTAIDLKPADPYSVIVLTGHGDIDSLRLCYDVGVSTFIKKPFNRYEVRGPVKNAIAMKQLTRHLDELVEARTADLQQRVREITSLNQFVRGQLGQYSDITRVYQDVLEGLHRLVEEAGALARQARSVQLPPFLDFSIPPPEDGGHREGAP